MAELWAPHPETWADKNSRAKSPTEAAAIFPGIDESKCLLCTYVRKEETENAILSQSLPSDQSAPFEQQLAPQLRRYSVGWGQNGNDICRDFRNWLAPAQLLSSSPEAWYL